jgi:hypothetical protein
VYFSWSAGYLHNTGSRSAVGATFKISADDDGHRYGPVLRYRRWLSPSWSLDIAPGLFIGGHDNFGWLRFPSATADITINGSDWVGLTLGVDVLRRIHGSTTWESHAGIKFGTWLAPLATVGLGILAAASY